MKTQLWTKAEISRLLCMLESGHPAAEMASLLQRTEASVRHKLLSLGYSSRRLVDSADVSSESSGEVGQERIVNPQELADQAKMELERMEVRRENRAVLNDYRTDLLEERIVAEFRSRLLDYPLRVVVPPLPAGHKTEATGDDVAVVVISDCHIGQVVDRRETEADMAYNPAVFMARLHHLEIEVARIINQHPVREVVVLFAGDIVHGQLGHSLEDNLTLPIATQSDLALHAFVPFLTRFSQLVERVQVHGVGGNHGRWPGTRKMPTERRWSQLDTIFYQSLQAVCQVNLANVHFEERFSARRLIDIGDFRILLLHGDQLRGGTYSSAGIQREMQRWLQRTVQTGQRPPNLIVLGDKHVSANLPVGLGEALINGSFVGEDVFAQNFAPSPPSQTLFFVSPAFGKTETHIIPLKSAKAGDALPYNLKPTLNAVIEGFSKSL